MRLLNVLIFSEDTEWASQHSLCLSDLHFQMHCSLKSICLSGDEFVYHSQRNNCISGAEIACHWSKHYPLSTSLSLSEGPGPDCPILTLICSPFQSEMILMSDCPFKDEMACRINKPNIVVTWLRFSKVQAQKFPRFYIDPPSKLKHIALGDGPLPLNLILHVPWCHLVAYPLSFL